MAPPLCLDSFRHFARPMVFLGWMSLTRLFADEPRTFTASEGRTLPATSSKGATARFFRQLGERHPKVARECFPLAKVALYDVRDVDLFAKCLPDLEPELDRWINDYKAQYAVLKPREGDDLIAGNKANLRDFAAFPADVAESRGDGALAAGMKAKVNAAVGESAVTALAP